MLFGSKWTHMAFQLRLISFQTKIQHGRSCMFQVRLVNLLLTQLHLRLLSRFSSMMSTQVQQPTFQSPWAALWTMAEAAVMWVFTTALCLNKSCLDRLTYSGSRSTSTTLWHRLCSSPLPHKLLTSELLR